MAKPHVNVRFVFQPDERFLCFENTSRLKCLDVEKSFYWVVEERVAAQQGFSLSPPFFSGIWLLGGRRGGVLCVLASSLRVGTLIGVDGARVSRLGVQRKYTTKKLLKK
jgi:hypothetical protein